MEDKLKIAQRKFFLKDLFYSIICTFCIIMFFAWFLTGIEMQEIVEKMKALQGQITLQKEVKDSQKTLQEEINPLKDQIEILRIQVNQLAPLLKDAKKVRGEK